MTSEERIEIWKRQRERESPKPPANIWEAWGLSTPANPTTAAQTARPKKSAKKAKKGAEK